MNSASNGGGNSTAVTGARPESSSENTRGIGGANNDEESNIDGSEVIFQNSTSASGKSSNVPKDHQASKSSSKHTS